MNRALSSRKAAAGEAGASFSPGNRARISRIVAFSEVIRPFLPDGFDRSPRSRAGTSSGDAVPIRNRSFRPGRARRSAKRTRPQAIPSAPTSRIARLTTFVSRLTVITARFPGYVSLYPRSQRVYRLSQALSQRKKPVRRLSVVVPAAPRRSTLEQSASPAHQEHGTHRIVDLQGRKDGPISMTYRLTGLPDAL